MSSSSSSSSTATSDPNGWIRNPPSVMVKVVGTSRETLNGQYGVAVHYMTDRSRYVVHLVQKQDQVSLKAENLVKCGWTETAAAQLQLLRNDPAVRRQVSAAYGAVSRALPSWMKPEHLAAAVAAVVMAAVYYLGFSRTLMIVSCAILIVMVIGPDVAAGCDWKTVVRNAPSRWNEAVRQHAPMGDRIASNRYLSGALACLLAFLMINALFGGGAAAAAAASSSSSSKVSPVTDAAAAAAAGGGGSQSSSSPAAAAAMVPPVAVADLERYYKLGFDDATERREYGTSLPPTPTTTTTTTATKPKGDDDLEDLPDWRSYDIDHHYDPTAPLASPAMKRPKSLWSYGGTVVSAYFVLKTVHELGVDAGGAASTWNFDRCRQNMITLEPWKLGILGFSVYRIVTTLFF